MCLVWVVLALVLISGGLIEHPDLLSMVNGGRGVLRDLVGNKAERHSQRLPGQSPHEARPPQASARVVVKPQRVCNAYIVDVIKKVYPSRRHTVATA